jgi:hypothetical protein
MPAQRALRNIDTVHARQAEIEDRGRIRLRTQLSLRGLAVANPVDLKALLPQPSTNAVAEQGVVFDKQNAHV